MKLKVFKPVTPSLRNLIQLNKTNLNNNPLIKSKIKNKKQKLGRNNSGTITAKHKENGHKKKYRTLNYNHATSTETCIVVSIEHDPFKTANIAAIYNIKNKKLCYILAPKNLKIGDVVKSGENAEIKNGHSLTLSKIPIGCLIHNISTKKGGKPIISRAAGAFSQLIEKTANFCKIKIGSGKQILVPIKCVATIGVVSNDFAILTNKGKAGRSRWMGKRPTVRGVAMNPIDHPHGGGEGKTSGGRTSVTPWGKPTKGGKTSRSKI